MPQNDLKTLPHNQKSTTHKISKRLGYDFLANQSSKQNFFDKKKETFLWTESRNAKDQELPGIISKDQEIEPQQSKFLQDAQETKETMPKTRKKYVEEMKKLQKSRIAEIAYLVKLVAHEKARKDRRRSSRRDKAEKTAWEKWSSLWDENVQMRREERSRS